MQTWAFNQQTDRWTSKKEWQLVPLSHPQPGNCTFPLRPSVSSEAHHRGETVASGNLSWAAVLHLAFLENQWLIHLGSPGNPVDGPESLDWRPRGISKGHPTSLRLSVPTGNPNLLCSSNLNRFPYNEDSERNENLKHSPICVVLIFHFLPSSLEKYSLLLFLIYFSPH